MAHADVILPTEPVQALPTIRSIGVGDLRRALAKGFDDFSAMPTHVVFLSVIYPAVTTSSPCSIRLRPASRSSGPSPQSASTS